jgi:hypothetical protein
VTLAQTDLPPEQLLGEIEDVLRTMPPRGTFRQETPENFSWLGRAAAVIDRWNSVKGALFNVHVGTLHVPNGTQQTGAIRGIIVMLNEARSDLRLRTLGPTEIAFGQGGVFDYFDEVRKVIETANQDILFIDRYLDAEFVSRYLPHVRAGVSIRLLAADRLATLVPAVDSFTQQSKATISLRSTSNFHDRYVIVDKARCYQSGASFKDGAKKAPTTLTEITDAFQAVQQTYEGLWNSAQVHR